MELVSESYRLINKNRNDQNVQVAHFDSVACCALLSGARCVRRQGNDPAASYLKSESINRAVE